LSSADKEDMRTSTLFAAKHIGFFEIYSVLLCMHGQRGGG